MRIIALSGALLGGCDPIEPMPSDLPCREAGYAIAARTTQCTGDAALGQARYERFRAQYACIRWQADDPRLAESVSISGGGGLDTGGTPHAADLWSCAFTLRNVPCELEPELGDDIDAWMDLDPGCSWVAKPKGGGR